MHGSVFGSYLRSKVVASRVQFLDSPPKEVDGSVLEDVSIPPQENAPF
jgi:hypothetical protein